jgi:glycosyltransferase involved in cell wall biosynthesis
MTMRILFLLRDELPPFRSDVKSLFGKYLAEAGIASDLLGQTGACGPVPLSWEAGTVIPAGRFRKGVLGQLLMPVKDAIALLRHRRPYDVIQVRDKIRTAAFALLVARIRDRPFVYWMSFPFVEGFAATARSRKDPGIVMRAADFTRVSLSRYLFYRVVLPNADHVFVQSEAMRTWLANKGFDRSCMTAVPMGVDTARVRRQSIVPADDWRLAGRRVVAYLGLLQKSRDSAFMLDLIESVKRVEPRALLLLIGDAPSAGEAQWIRDEIAKRDLHDDVVLTGWLKQEQALGYLVRAELGLSPIPRSELYDVSSPTKLLEYFALGVPGVANDIPDQKLAIDESGAGLCVPMEVAAFHDAVVELLRNPSLRRECAVRGPQYIERERSYEILSRRVAKVYNSMLDPRMTSVEEASALRNLPLAAKDDRPEH